jgi:hypothetical protein
MRFAKHVGLFSVLSIAALPLSCSSEDDPAPPSAMAGASGSSTTPPTGGTSSGSGTGGAAPASTGGQVAQTGGAGPATGGTSPSGVGGTSGGTSGGTPAGGANGGAPMGGAPAPTGGSAPVAGGGAGGVVTAGGGGAGGATTPANPLSHLADSAKTVGALLANRFSKQTLAFSSVANLPGDGYKTACEWYGSLGVAKHTSNQELLTALVNKFTPLKSNFVMAMTSGEAHVDRYIFGMVPLEIFLQTGDMSFLSLGTNVADTQQTTNQVRNAIDDMFMMTILQVQAYRATKNDKYLTFMSKTMVDYLKAQQANGLFFHNVNEAKVHWGRGNGWFAAGMAEIMRDLPKTAGDYATIEAGYEKMMDGQREQLGRDLGFGDVHLRHDRRRSQRSAGCGDLRAGDRQGLGRHSEEDQRQRGRQRHLRRHLVQGQRRGVHEPHPLDGRRPRPGTGALGRGRIAPLNRQRQSK